MYLTFFYFSVTAPRIKTTVKGTVGVISIDPPVIEGRVGFSTGPFKRIKDVGLIFLSKETFPTVEQINFKVFFIQEISIISLF